MTPLRFLLEYTNCFIVFLWVLDSVVIEIRSSVKIAFPPVNIS